MRHSAFWERVDRIEARAEIKLARGQHVDVIAEMTSLAGEYPLSERPHALLMHALHVCGRPAEALRTYRDLHSRFVAELGIEPSLQLRELHQKLLADDLIPGPAGWKKGSAALAPVVPAPSGHR